MNNKLTFELLCETIDRVIDEKEAAKQGRGVQLEWAIVYWALKIWWSTQKQTQSKVDKLKKRFKNFPEILRYGKGEMSSAGEQAAIAAKNAGADLSKVFHSDEEGIQGDPEPKTDILFGKHRVSVKMEGPIQLTSSEGRRTAKMFQTILNEMLEDKKFRTQINQAALKGIIKRVQEIPTKMIDPKNLQKAIKARPNQVLPMLKKGKILDEHNWKIWEANNKVQITSDIIKFLESHPEFNFRLIEEAMTGKRNFGASHLATADYIITPSFYGPIDKNYIKKTMNNTKIQVRAKSRSGITSATLRFDVASASKIAAQSLDESLDEGALGNAKDLVINFAKKWVNKFKNQVRTWFTSNIDDVVQSATKDLTLAGVESYK